MEPLIIIFKKEDMRVARGLSLEAICEIVDESPISIIDDLNRYDVYSSRDYVVVRDWRRFEKMP